jgi:hypothetical protein
VGQRPDDTGMASGHTDLIGLCEEIVEDVSKRMRIADTIMSPGSRRRTTNGSCCDSLPKQSGSPEGKGAVEGYFSVVLFDTRSVDNCQVSSNSGIRIILENLLVSTRGTNMARKH